jgi:hypothetical protein
MRSKWRKIDRRRHAGDEVCYQVSSSRGEQDAIAVMASGDKSLGTRIVTSTNQWHAIGGARTQTGPAFQLRRLRGWCPQDGGALA